MSVSFHTQVSFSWRSSNETCNSVGYASAITRSLSLPVLTPLRGKLTSRRPHTAMYNDGPARRASVSVFGGVIKQSVPGAIATGSVYAFNAEVFVAAPHAVAMCFD